MRFDSRLWFHRVGLVLATALAFGVSAGPAMSATTVSVYVDDRSGDSIVVSGDAANNRITIVHVMNAIPYLGGVFMIEDTRRVKSDSPQCTHESPTRIRCLAEVDATVGVEGGLGDDRIAVRRSKCCPYFLLYGDLGNDVLKGGPDGDRLDGGIGKDVLRGRRGSDQLDAHHLDRDRRIACGGGRDLAYIDKRKDPKPKRCEKVHGTYPMP